MFLKQEQRFYRLTILRYSLTTWNSSSFPRGLNIDGFHSAARAIITDEDPVSLRNFSMSSYANISLEPPLKMESVTFIHVQEKNQIFTAKLGSNLRSHENRLQMSHSMTKPMKWHVHPAKTQISLGIHPV